MPPWIFDHWPWLLGIVFVSGGSWALLKVTPRRLDAAFKRIDDEREARFQLTLVMEKGFSESKSDLRHLLEEMVYQRQAHHEQMDKINGQLMRIGDKLDILPNHDKRLAVIEERVDAIMTRGCGRLCESNQ